MRRGVGLGFWRKAGAQGVPIEPPCGHHRGNWCDADLDDSGFVNFGDLAAFKAAFGTSDPDADLDGSGFVNFGDLARFKALFGQPPGPSEVAP